MPDAPLFFQVGYITTYPDGSRQSSSGPFRGDTPADAARTCAGWVRAKHPDAEDISVFPSAAPCPPTRSPRGRNLSPYGSADGRDIPSYRLSY